jgi:branched-chain amino acid transport system ATP-binding protein
MLNTTGNILEIQDLTMRFGGLLALKEYSLQVNKGQILGIIGPNGAGKSTVFNVLSGIYPPTSGSVLFQGENITTQRPDRITAKGIARTFQNIRLFHDLTVLDNVKIAHHVRCRYSFLSALLCMSSYVQEEQQLERHVLDNLTLFGLSQYRDILASNLPYGEQRKLEIVRALNTNPSLLLLDEPAAGMNEEETSELMALIKKIQEMYTLTILIIEHDMKFIMGLCDKIQVLDSGKVIAFGSPKEVQSNPEVIKAYLGEAV